MCNIFRHNIFIVPGASVPVEDCWTPVVLQTSTVHFFIPLSPSFCFFFFKKLLYINSGQKKFGCWGELLSQLLLAVSLNFKTKTFQVLDAS